MPSDIRHDRTRDARLDVLKGFSCLLMVLAHAPFAYRHPWLLPFGYLGQLAPVLFFAVSGITAAQQSARKRHGDIVVKYAAIFVLGFSYNAILQPRFLWNPQMEILQFIALSSMIVAVVGAVARTRDALLAAAGCFLVHFIAQIPGAPRFPGTWMLFAPGVFPVFPWLAFCFLGLAALNLSQRGRLAAAAVCGAVLVGSLTVGMWSFTKWNMSVQYFVLCCSVLFLGFWLASTKLRDITPRTILFLGRNSLLFLFAHWAWIKVAQRLDLSSFTDGLLLGLAGWTVVTGLTLGTMHLALLANRRVAALFDAWGAWLGLALAILVLPAAPHPTSFVFAAELAFGFAFAMNYPALSPLATALADRFRLCRVHGRHTRTAIADARPASSE